MKSTALVVLAACVLAACASQPNAPAKQGGSTIQLNIDKEGKPVVDADEQQVIDGVRMIQSGKIMAAIDGPLNDVVNKYEARYGTNHPNVYSARGMSDGLVYATLATKEKHNVQVLGPAWAMAYWARGFAYGEMARYDDEQAELEKALALAPMDGQYNNELAYVLIRKRDWTNAMEHYKTGEAYAQITAGDAAPHVQCVALRGQGYVLVELHRLDEAEAKYRECLKVIPNEPKSLGEIGFIKEQRAKSAQGH